MVSFSAKISNHSNFIVFVKLSLIEMISYVQTVSKIKYLLTLWEILQKLVNIVQLIQWESELVLMDPYIFLMDAKSAQLSLEPNVEVRLLR